MLQEEILDALIKEQMRRDKQTGTCGICEAGVMEIQFGEDRRFLPDEVQAELIAICSIMNDLAEKVSEILKKNPPPVFKKIIVTNNGVEQLLAYDPCEEEIKILSDAILYIQRTHPQLFLTMEKVELR